MSTVYSTTTVEWRDSLLDTRTLELLASRVSANILALGLDNF
jgi:hypothetical protein